MAAQTGLLPTQPITAQINLGLSLWLDEKRGSRQPLKMSMRSRKPSNRRAWSFYLLIPPVDLVFGWRPDRPATSHGSSQPGQTRAVRGGRGLRPSRKRRRSRPWPADTGLAPFGMRSRKRYVFVFIFRDI